jgi:hypothetical protein
MIKQHKLDLVYTYVDNTDLSWVEKHKQHTKKDFDTDRFNFRNEIVFSLKTVETYASFIDKIYIVSDEQTFDVSFLSRKTQKKISFIDHKEIIPEEFLPTFNSCCIEMFLHNIPNLKENFVYLNDDVFFGNFISLETFIENSKIKLFGTKHNANPYLLYEKDCCVMYEYTHDLFNEKFNVNLWFEFSHTVFNLSIENCKKVFETFKEYLIKTARLKTRSYSLDYSMSTNKNNIESWSFLTLCNLMLIHDDLSSIGGVSCGYVHTLNYNTMRSLLKQRPRLICINYVENNIVWQDFTKRYFIEEKWM